jgi:mannose-6-phosphate isomerase-like protein (cupin superfamily)
MRKWMDDESRREWGHYDILSDEENHKVKRITVYPGKRLSLQRHKKRAEHWYIIEGSAIMTLNDNVFQLEPGDSRDIKADDIHRIENPGTADLIFIEVQTGSYFGEDDIERLHDDYGRT